MLEQQGQSSRKLWVIRSENAASELKEKKKEKRKRREGGRGLCRHLGFIPRKTIRPQVEAVIWMVFCRLWVVLQTRWFFQTTFGKANLAVTLKVWHHLWGSATQTVRKGRFKPL